MARLATLIISVALIAAACGDDDSDDGDTDAGPATTVDAAETSGATTTVPATTAAPTTAAAATETLRILVSNDDGVGAEGISQVVAALTELPDTEVTVSAPAENQSGTSDSMTDGDLVSTETTTADGHPATAVEGFPADAVAAGLEAMTEPPHLVVSGINEGQNVGGLTELSGTVGAARTGARAGIPALATSQALGEPPDYPTGVAVVVTWVEEHRDALLAGEVDATVVNFNFPTCPVGEPRGEVVEVPLGSDMGDRSFDQVDCEAEPPVPADDIDAIIWGFTSETELTF
jgi:5'-nucleotidase